MKIFLVKEETFVMQSIIFLIIFIFTFVNNSFAVQCNIGNPCELNGDFSAPNYQCLEPIDQPNNVICTCPNGQTVVNARCRR